MLNVTTLTDLLETNRHYRRDITYLEGEHDIRTVSFAMLHERALGILYHLQRLGARPGDKLIVALGRNEQFVDAFWAAVLGGIVPVPVAVGTRDEHRYKLLRVARRLGNPYIYTEARSLERISALAERTGELDTMQRLHARAFRVDDLEDISRPGTVHRARPDDVAFIQFSSGSTSEPKGVVLTHANIIANARGATEAARFTEDDISLSWMPLTHDMGLIGFHLIMFFNRIHAHLMPTDLFVRRPMLWLQFASRVRASVLCSPNFGYKHCLKGLGERPLEGVDLSSVRLIFNGAEPISVPLCEQFLARLEPAGLAGNALYPVYGLAEASLAVSFPPPGAPMRTVSVNRHQLSVGSEMQFLDKSARDAVRLICEGRALPNGQVRITDDGDHPLPEGRIGHLQIRGENVTHGYHEDPQANAAAFTVDGWLRTGDLAVVHDGDLYLSGRAKEIIFVNGQNYYPHDLESIAQRIGGLELGKVVAAGVRRPPSEVEQLVLFVLHRGSMEDFLPLATAVTGMLNETTGLEVAEVVPVKRIPKTTSGKIQRHLLKKDFADARFDADLKALAALRDARGGSESTGRTAIEQKLTTICDAVLGGTRLDPTDNLFELGASSLKLIEIHEHIDREYPGLIDLTELFDFPTIAELARHLQRKLAHVT